MVNMGTMNLRTFSSNNIFFLQEIISGWKLPAVYSGTYNECKDYMNRSLSEGNYQIVPEEQYSIDIP